MSPGFFCVYSLKWRNIHKSDGGSGD
ncbi:hypothetical protein RHECNPAF_280081 [Rhizobium etli CNPAF512]|nr:hypothetical protein RHECNPAF_280081 [Rhizobium etli CNPAF512]